MYGGMVLHHPDKSASHHSILQNINVMRRVRVKKLHWNKHTGMYEWWSFLFLYGLANIFWRSNTSHIVSKVSKIDNVCTCHNIASLQVNSSKNKWQIITMISWIVHNPVRDRKDRRIQLELLSKVVCICWLLGGVAMNFQLCEQIGIKVWVT